MASHIGRRKFLATLGSAAAAWPLAARRGGEVHHLLGEDRCEVVHCTGRFRSDSLWRIQQAIAAKGARQTKEEAMKHVAVTATLLAGLGVFLIPPAYAAEGHTFVTPSDLKWTDVPGLPGAQIAVIEGPLNEAGELNEAVPFTFPRSSSQRT